VRFDGEAFRTVWSPDDLVARARVTFSESGFAIDHDLRQEPVARARDVRADVNGCRQNQLIENRRPQTAEPRTEEPRTLEPQNP
jgi:hypothetical protein